MIYRLRYCNKDGVEARVDIQKGSSTPVIDVEGTERPFVLSYNNDKGDKSGMFLSSSADIEIYETPEFNINNLKTSNETELSVTHYINNVIGWQGFIIPDFFSIEVRSNPVITMTASDRLGTLKNVTLSDLPSMISLRELAILCLDKTGLSLPLRTMADFNNGTGINDFFNSKILTQRLSDTKGRSISCYDILSSILTASNSFLVQRSGGWHIINKIQHEAGSGKLYTGATSFINWSDVIFNFSDISIGGRRTIIPVASTVGVFHEFGGSKTYPSNYNFKDGANGWTVNFPDEMEARFDNRNILGFDILVSGGGYQPVYGTKTNNPHMVVYGFRGALNYVKSEDIVVPTGYGTDVEIKFDINASAPIWNFGSFQRMAVFAVKGTDTKALVNGSFISIDEVTESQYMNRINFEQGTVYVGELARVATESFGVSGKLSDAEGLDGYTIHIRLYSSDRAYATVINFATINFAPAGAMAKGNLYKTERTDNYTKDHDIDTSLFADYITTGLNGYFYRYAIDDTSSLYNSLNELTSKWTAYNDPEQLPLLQHITRQRSRLFSVAHDLLSADIEVNNFDPLAIFVACNKRHTVVSAQFDFFKSNLSVELEEIDFQIASARDFIYSYFGDGESGIKSIGGISGGGGGGGTGGGLTPEQIEILSWWKKDPDNPNTIFTEMNAYSKLELSAYGAGDGGGGGGSDYERLDTWASYDSSKAEWVLSAFLGNDLNTRVTAIDGRVTDLENSAGGGGDGSVTSVGISVPTGLSVSNSPITSSGVIAIGLQAGYSIPTTAKQGQWDTAYSNNHTHSNKTVLDGITSALVSNWNTAFTNNHTHANKTQLDLITQSNIDVLAKLSIVNGNLQIDGNAYATGELSSYGAGTGGGGGGIIETVYGYGNLGQTFNNANLTDTFNAYTINQINTRLVSVENGSATTVNTTGTGNAITSISKAGSVITANKGLTFSLSNHTHSYLPLSGGTLTGDLSTTGSITPKTLYFPDASSATSNKVGFYLWGNQWQVNWRDPSTGAFLYNLLVINGETKNAEFYNTVTAPTFSGNLSGNATSATKLQTARTLTIGNTGKTFDGTANVSWSAAEMGVLPLTGGAMANTNLVTNLNADLLDGKHGSDYRGAITLPHIADHEQIVIGLVNLDNSNINRESWSSGQIYVNRPNGLSWMGGVINYSVQKRYNASTMWGYIDSTQSGIQLCTFTYNGVKYGGIRCYPAASQVYGGAKLYGNWSDTTPFVVKYRNNSGALNSEVDSSIIINGSDIYEQRLRTSNNIYAFEATTLAGYGITDAVTLNTAQTITGEKTFDANIILGVNRSIRGTDNYTGVWNVDNKLWRFGSSSTGSVSNIRSEKVGIGTDSPSEKLHVVGNILATGTTTTTKVIFAAAGWSMEQVGSELQMKHNNVLKMRFTSAGSIVATNEITAFA